MLEYKMTQMKYTSPVSMPADNLKKNMAMDFNSTNLANVNE
jgi:hypothetical protein